jgi:hypothetical protein
MTTPAAPAPADTTPASPAAPSTPAPPSWPWRLFFVPALVVLAVGAVKLWREQR